VTDTVVAVFAALVGAIMGSFLNVCISRWPQKLSIVHPRSRCPSCGRPILWYENVPVVSWIVLRGRCHGCRAPISLMYPVIELVVAAGWLAAVMSFGPTLTALRLAVFGTVLLGIAMTDAMHYVIPDGFTVFGIIWNLSSALVAFAISDQPVMAATNSLLAGACIGAPIGEASMFAGPYCALLGACVGAGAIAIVGWLGEVALKKEAMGFGDVTLMAMAGAALGPTLTLLTIFVAALIGAVVFLGVVYPITWLRSRGKHEPFTPPLVPFGVFLAPAAMVTLLWGAELLTWYKGLVTGP
jgi:leader peptidase (prepilin peptidase)/N-methyltransferase